jgi:UDP-N-acetylbacillosamine N-acetyltransferase
MYTSYISDSTYFIPAFGNNEFRKKWINQLVSSGCRLASLIHPRVYVSPTAWMCYFTKCMCSTDVVIGYGCIINLGTFVDHGLYIKG